MNLDKYIISSKSNIRETIKRIDENGNGFVLVVDNDHLVIGLITDGDFRRSVMKGISLSDNCLAIVNKKFIYSDESISHEDAKRIFTKYKIDQLPILKNGILIKVLIRKSLDFDELELSPKKVDKINVVIMAGGQGTRMKPFTNIFPKPLIPIGEKSMLEVIMDEYNKYFNSKFFITVNFKANLIKQYLNDFKNIYKFSYISEPFPLGTGGALKFLQGKIKTPFFISNCDILIKANYNEIYEYHLLNKNSITIVASFLHYKVPYGVCELNNEGLLQKLVEKPEFDFLINSGMYVINQECLELIPENIFYNFTDLISEVKEKGGKVGVFPVSEKSYYDTGQWNAYASMLTNLGTASI